MYFQYDVQKYFSWTSTWQCFVRRHWEGYTPRSCVHEIVLLFRIFSPIDWRTMLHWDVISTIFMMTTYLRVYAFQCIVVLQSLEEGTKRRKIRFVPWFSYFSGPSPSNKQRYIESSSDNFSWNLRYVVIMENCHN